MTHASVRTLLFALGVLLGGDMLRAEHFPGATLTYRCTGENLYEFTLLVWRDCSGAALQPQSLLFNSTCGIQFSISSLQAAEVLDVSPLCNAQAGSSTCAGGPLPGMEAHRFVTTQFLSPCADWTVTWSLCCRNPSLNVQGTPGLYAEARLNTIAAPCAASPVADDMHIPFVCVGQPVSYAPGWTGGDAPLQRFRFIEARFAAPEPFAVNYVPPHYFGEPWTGMVIDSLTGAITFTPTAIGHITTVVQVDLRDTDGTWLGSVMRDFVFVASACDNSLPDAAAGTITALSGNGVQLGPRTFRACTNGTTCVDLHFTDADAGQSLSITTNAAEVLPGTTLQLAGTNPVVLGLCVDAMQAAPGLHTFTVVVADNSCPLVGTQVYTFTVEVSPPPVVAGDGYALVCTLTPPFLLIDSLVDPLDGGYWTDPLGDPHDGILHPFTQPAGDYVYTVPVADDCPGTATVAVSFLPADDPVCVLLDIEERETWRPVFRPNPTSGQLWWELSYDAGPILLHLFDATGRALHRVEPSYQGGTGAALLPHELPNGMYMLRVQGADGRSTAHRLLLLR